MKASSVIPEACLWPQTGSASTGACLMFCFYLYNFMLSVKSTIVTHSQACRKLCEPSALPKPSR